MTDQAVKEPTVIKPTATPKVTEAPPKELKVQNPHLTLKVNIFGLPPYGRTGLRGNVMKTGRGWIRARGLTVNLEDVEIVDTAEAGDEVDVEGKKVKADLKVITFTEACIVKSGRTIIPTKPVGRQPVDGKDKTPKTKAPKAKAQTTAGETKVPKPGTAPTENLETKPEDW